MAKFMHHSVFVLLVLFFPLSGALTLQFRTMKKYDVGCGEHLDPNDKKSWGDVLKEPDVAAAIKEKLKTPEGSKYVANAELTLDARSKQRFSTWPWLVLIPKHPGKKYGCGHCEFAKVAKAADMPDKFKNAPKVAFLTLDGSECHQGPGWALQESLTRHQCQPLGRVEYFNVYMYLGCDCHDIDPNYGTTHDGVCFEGACQANTWKCGTTWYRNFEYLIDPRMEDFGKQDLKIEDYKTLADAKNGPTAKLGPIDFPLQASCGCKNFNPGLRAANGYNWWNPRIKICDEGAAYYTGPTQCGEFGGQKKLSDEA